jgi:hypothetical protein
MSRFAAADSDLGSKGVCRNLPDETGEMELHDLFARAGAVETVKAMRDMATGRARGLRSLR